MARPEAANFIKTRPNGLHNNFLETSTHIPSPSQHVIFLESHSLSGNVKFRVLARQVLTSIHLLALTEECFPSQCWGEYFLL